MLILSKISIGNLKETIQPDVLKAALAEFIAMIIYIFPIEGCVLAYNEMGKDQILSAWFSAAISHAFALFVAISVTINISGGHVNPAVTFGAFLGGHITFCKSILYLIAQMLGSVVACFLLKFATGLVISPTPPIPWNAVIFEIVLTFSLVYTVYATAIDPKRGNIGVISPIAIGLALGANILSGGALYGAAMNPAVAFGQAMISWTWSNHWVYWLGNFIGAAIAALIYETLFIG